MTDHKIVEKQRTDAHYAVHLANRALKGHPWRQSSYVRARRELDKTMLLLSQAKWLFGAYNGSYAGYLQKQGGEPELAQASALFARVIESAGNVQSFLESGAPLPPVIVEPFDAGVGAEIKYYAGTPIVPSVAPIIVVSGSNREMGRQYAQQAIDIFGLFIFRWQAERRLEPTHLDEIQRWAAELKNYMPKVLEFARGWAEGASASGLPMSEAQALAIWTGVNPPMKSVRPFSLGTTSEGDEKIASRYLGGDGEARQPREKPDLCSGFCAWGEASRDGRLVFGATTDHDCTFQATIVAFPERGNNFVYTPFATNGAIPELGHNFMAGHPGFNDKGLAYIHHGGALYGEPPEQWGYGVRRGPMTFHLLQFASSAREARELIMSYPVGDAGVSMSNPGGMWADDDYAFVVEGRDGAPGPLDPVVREGTFDRDGALHSFLYAANNAVSPRSGALNCAPTSGKGFVYDLEAGWYAPDLATMKSGTIGEFIRRRATKNSAGRNRRMYRMLLAGEGRIDLDYVMTMLRTGGTVPEGDMADVVARFDAGEEWDASPAHRANAFVVAGKPDKGPHGIYRGCVGPAERLVNVNSPGHGYYYYDETAAFWEIVLAEKAEDMTRQAAELARHRVEEGRAALAGWSDTDRESRLYMHEMIDDADQALASAADFQDRASALRDSERLRELSRALRCYTRAQVRAGQVLEAVKSDAASLARPARATT